MPIARQHHYIPQFYLRGFAKKPHKNAKLYVYDITRGEWWPKPSNPKNLGTKRDFNRVEVEGLPPDAIETELSAFETLASAVLRDMENQHRMPEGECKVRLMTFVALLGIRHPRVRHHHGEFVKKILDQITALSLATKERWDSTVNEMKAAGYGADFPEVTYEEMVRFHEERRYNVTIKNSFFMAAEFKALNTIVEALLARKWETYIATAETGQFITSDWPVRLRWRDPEMAGQFFPPGHALVGTEVIFPVSKNIAIVGDFEGQDRMLSASRTEVARINTAMIEGCERHLYSSHDDFEFLGPVSVLRSSYISRIFTRI